MKTSFKTMLAASTAAMLAACGGGGDGAAGPTAPVVQPAWASPAMFVPAGQSQISVAISDCTVASNSYLSRQQIAAIDPAPIAVTSPSLVINSAGDVIFSGFVAPANAAAVLVRVNFADNLDRFVLFNSNGLLNTFGVENASDGEILVNSDDAATAPLKLRADNSATGLQYTCNTVASAQPAIPPSEARLAAVFTPGLQRISTDSGDTSAPIANNVAVWDNFRGGRFTLPSNQTNVQFAGLNITTGALTVGPVAASATATSVPLLLSGSTVTAGAYYESFSGGTSPEKSINLTLLTSDRGRLEFSGTARGADLDMDQKLGERVGR